MAEEPQDLGEARGENGGSELEQERMRSVQLDSLLRAGRQASLGALAGGLAHEISNPVAIIQSNLKSLSRHVEKLARYGQALDAWHHELAGQEDPELRRLAQELEHLQQELNLPFVLEDLEPLIQQTMTVTSRLQGLVQSLRRFTRAPAEDRPADVNELIESALTLLAYEIKYRVVVGRDLGRLPPVRCRQDLLGQVLLDVLLHVARTAADGAQIVIRTREKDGVVRLQIHDETLDLNEAGRARLFDPLSAWQGEERGATPGLAQARVVLARLGGEIRVSGLPEGGTTIEVDLPLQLRGT